MKPAQVIPLMPNAQEVAQAQESGRALSQYRDADRVSVTIKGRHSETDSLIIPGYVMQLLISILAEIGQGNAISIMPIHAELTTQEAADLLNVSRSHLIQLLEEGVLPFYKVGTHRRVRAHDLLTYRQRLIQQRNHALDELAELSQELGMGY